MKKENKQGYEKTPNIWVKAEGTGLPRGYEIIKELDELDITTLPKMMTYLKNKYGEAPCLGTRKLLKRNRIREGDKTIEKLTLGEYEYKSHNEMNNEIYQLGTGLRKMGIKKQERIGLLAETRADWFTSALGALHSGMTIVTLYTNLSDSGLIHGITETELETLITSYEMLPRVASILKSCPTIKSIIIMEDQLEGVGNTDMIPDSVNVIPLSDLKKEVVIDQDSEPDERDLAIIMYTSGSTGIPKGVEITHRNVIKSIYSYFLQANVGPGDRYLAFLPLAHIMELITEIAQMTLGVTIAYSTPLTLTNSSPKIAAGTLGDAVVAQPTSMTAVTLILDRILKGIFIKVSKAGILKQKLFEKALNTKLNNENSFMSKIYDAVVFKKVRAELGGRLRMMVIGGAPVSPDTHSKMRAIFGCTIQVGYGCTETTAGAASMSSYDTRTGHVGPTNYLCSIKIISWEEGGYLTTDKPYARGEIIIGGDCVVEKYFKNEEETKNSLYKEDGTNWFRTGDIGEFDETGVLKIIDRKKDLIKLINGEYVSLGGIDACLKTNALVENTCTFADSSQQYVVCVVVPNPEPFLKRVKKELNLDNIYMEEACSHPGAVNILLREIQSHGKKYGLNRWDIPKRVYLTPNPWTPEGGLVTAAFKLRRRNLENKYKEQIRDMYSE